MGVKAKVAVVIVLALVLVLGLWHLSRAPTLPSVGVKYVSAVAYSRLGSWMEVEAVPSGRMVLGFSVSNLTFPRTFLSTTYSLVISKVNETVNRSYVESISLRVTGLTVEDNYDGTTTSWGKVNDLNDAVQVISIQLFQTSGQHLLRFTVTYEVYSLLLIGYAPEHSTTRSFNVTQSIL